MNERQKTKIVTLDELFGMPKDGGQNVVQIKLYDLHPFENHPFKVTQDAEFSKLVDSIKENGVLIPAIVRKKESGYEIIAGHRRKAACEALGLDTLPALISEMTDEQAVVSMVDSNVQRENILPSEKAAAYKMKLEALKRQAGRPKNNSSQVGTNFRSDTTVAENTGESRNQIQRYIRLTELIPQLLQMVDEKKIAFNPAVELSYLPKKEQTLLLSAMEAEQSTPSLSQAQKLKALSSEGNLDETAITKVIQEQKSNQKEQIKIPYDKIKEIIKRDMNPKELEDFILRAIADYQKRLNQREKNRDAR